MSRRNNEHDGHHGVFDFLRDLGQDVVDGLFDVVETIEGFTSEDDDRLTVESGFDYDILAPIAMHPGLPYESLPALGWTYMVGRVSVEIFRNQHAVAEAQIDVPHPKHAAFRIARELKRGIAVDPEAELKAAVRRLRTRASRIEWLRELGQNLRARTAPDGPVSSIADYDQLFLDLPKPPYASVFREDAAFAERRLAGPNPTSLVRIEAVPAGFPVTDAHVGAVLPGVSLDDALSAGHVYLLDYGGRSPKIPGTYPACQKFPYEPLALFVVDTGNDGVLVPVAIQCGQDPATYPVVGPKDGDAWDIAKTIVDVADGNFHELVAHLGRTHLVVEPFVGVTTRTLGCDHPLRRFLTPHFEGTQFINWAAGEFLIAPKNAVDELLAGTIDADRVAAVTQVASRSFADSYLPVWLKAQGLDDPERLPHYPFRDDALRVWSAIEDWVRSYVAIHWPDDGAVIADGPLQEWSRDLAAFDGGRVAGFGDGPGHTIVTTDYLVGALTMVVFTASAMHAAVNFPQRSVMSYPPAMPLAGYRAAPRAGESPTHEDWMHTLPPLDQALIQVNVLTLLGGVYYTQLGQYRPDTFEDPREQAALVRFQQALAELEQQIRHDNEQGPRARFPYVHLLPSRIPQSINV